MLWGISTWRRGNDSFRGELIWLGTHNTLRHKPLPICTTIAPVFNEVGSLWYLWIVWYASYTCNTKWIFDLISAYFKLFLNEHSCRLHQRLDIVKDMFTELFAQQDWSLNYSNSWYTVTNVWDHQEENVSLIFYIFDQFQLRFCNFVFIFFGIRLFWKFTVISTTCFWWKKIFLKQNKDSCAGKEVERVKEQMICMQEKTKWRKG